MDYRHDATTMMSRQKHLLRRVRIFAWMFIVGLVLSGVTVIPLQTEVNDMVKVLGLEQSSGRGSVIAQWLLNTRDALNDTSVRHPFLLYGTDWLAFGHFMIAIVFIGVLRDPVRNRWLFDFGLIACALVVPYAFAFGAVRGIPVWWRLIDCSFGVFGAVPLWFCIKWTLELEQLSADNKN